MKLLKLPVSIKNTKAFNTTWLSVRKHAVKLTFNNPQLPLKYKCYIIYIQVTIS